MKHQAPQNEFGFAAEAFNLFSDRTTDGERITREREAAAKAREFAATQQAAMFQ